MIVMIYNRSLIQQVKHRDFVYNVHDPRICIVL